MLVLEVLFPQWLAVVLLLGIMPTADMKSLEDVPAHAFARNLLRLREARDLTQEELEFRAGVKQTQISRYENAKTAPDLKTLLKLATVLNVTLEVLVHGMDAKFDAVYQGLSMPTGHGSSDINEHEATWQTDVSNILHTPSPVGGTHDPGIADLDQAREALRRAASDILSVINILPPGPDPVARNMGPELRPRAPRPRPRKGKKDSPTATQEKRR